MDRPDVFTYRDFRRWLRDVVEARRAKDAKHSLSYYSRLIGASESYLKLVVARRRALNPDKALTLARKLKLAPAESSYFLTLVMKDQAETPALAAHFDGLLAGMRSGAIEYSRRANDITLFSDALTWELFSLVGVEGFDPDPQWIASRLRRKISPARAERAFAALLHSGAVRLEDGRYRAKDIILQHHKGVEGAYIVALRRGIQFLEESPGDAEAHFDSFCLIVSDEQYAVIKEQLGRTRAAIADVVKRKEGSGARTRLAFLNMNLFPVTAPPAHDADATSP